MYLGIDPGAQGGMVVLNSEGKVFNAKTLKGMTTGAIWRWVDDHVNGVEVDGACIEKVGGYIGGDGEPGSRMFTFGQSYGWLEMALTATVGEDRFERVIPQTWQKSVGVEPRRKGEEKRDFKRRLKEMACRLFPDVNVTNSTADALLIAYYCRLKYGPKQDQMRPNPAKVVF